MANGAAVQGGTGRNSTKVIIVVGSVVLVALVGVIIALVMVVLNRGESERVVYVGEEPLQRTRVVNEGNVGEVVSDLREPPTPVGYYEVSMNTNWVFPNGASPSSNAFVENVASNTNDVYFDLQLRSTGETIYESPLLPLGEQLTNIQLSRDLAPGRYDCVIIYHLVDDTQRTVSTLSMGMTVTVEG